MEKDGVTSEERPPVTGRERQHKRNGSGMRTAAHRSGFVGPNRASPPPSLAARRKAVSGAKIWEVLIAPTVPAAHKKTVLWSDLWSHVEPRAAMLTASMAALIR